MGFEVITPDLRKTPGSIAAGVLALAICAIHPAAAQDGQKADQANAQDAAPARTVSGEPTKGIEAADDKPTPFGQQIFAGGFKKTRPSAYNPNYTIQTGDSIAVNLYGAQDVAKTLTVDAQGNIFLPDVGPIQVAGLSQSAMNDRVKDAVSRVYTDKVGVYTTLQEAQPVSVFVTGFVEKPGQYAGSARETVLSFLDRAGGIDPQQGSYRDIVVKRDDSVVSRVDLYDFIVDGEKSGLQLQNGDTIVVRERGGVVRVEGEARRTYAFEIDGKTLSGERLIELAQPKPAVTHVLVEGMRDGTKTKARMRLERFGDGDIDLQSGDKIRFEEDARADSMFVRIDGAYEGNSRFRVPRDTRLKELLANVEIDKDVANTDAISIKRKAVRERQKEQIRASLRRLQEEVVKSPIKTKGGAKIREAEANLLKDFIQRARSVEPEGRMVVARNGDVANVRLRPGDVIEIPRQTRLVNIKGEVRMPRSVLHESQASVEDYVGRVGGFTDAANKERVVVIHANGAVDIGGSPDVRPGDEILVLPKVETSNFQFAKGLSDVLFKAATSAATILAL